MTPLISAACVTCLLFGSVAAQIPSSSLRIESVHLGQDVTLKCFYQHNTGLSFNWFKQRQGQKPELVSESLMTDASLKGDFKNDSRFKLEFSSGKNHLKISNVQMSDSATYYCTSGRSFKYEFLEGIIVHVKGSGLNIQTMVHESGGSVTLNCSVQTGTCDGEHSVYWFKDSEESHPGVIYTHGDINDQCERKPNTQTHSCVFNLPLKDLNASHAGTYYCAVASCGYILFGDGTKLDFEEKVDSSVLLYVLSGCLAFSVLLVVVLACTMYNLYKKKSCTCKDPTEGSSAASAPDAQSGLTAGDLHYAALSERKAGESGSRMDASSDCVYSTVKP